MGTRPWLPQSRVHSASLFLNFWWGAAKAFGPIAMHLVDLVEVSAMMKYAYWLFSSCIAAFLLHP
jgi:hypothetical protein